MISIVKCAGDSVSRLLESSSHRDHSAHFQPELTLIRSAATGLAASQDLLSWWRLWHNASICARLQEWATWACSVMWDILLYYIQSSIKTCQVYKRTLCMITHVTVCDPRCTWSTFTEAVGSFYFEVIWKVLKWHNFGNISSLNTRIWGSFCPLASW